MNADYTFGVFPQIQLGGETGTGGGVRIFHSNLAGRRKRVEAMFVYSGVRGQTGQFVYHDPALFGSSLFARLHGAYLETDNHAASVNASVRDDPNRVFEITQTDASLSLGWSLHSGTLAGTRPNVSLEATFGHHYRDFRALTGGTAPLTDVGSTPRAASLPGLNEKPSFLSFGGRLILDNRDYRRPLKIPPHPWLGHLPGEVVTFSQGLYHFHRNTSYPRRGGRLLLGGSFATGSEDVRFVHTEPEVQGFLPLFRAGQVIAVRSRLERVFRLDTGTAPYVDLVQLGGGREMRGFRRGFFRGEGSLLINVEYRYLIWDTWNAFFFWDEGQVFDTFDEVGWEGFRTTIGGGLTFRTPTSLIAKIQIGYSFSEKPLIGFTFSQDF